MAQGRCVNPVIDKLSSNKETFWPIFASFVINMPFSTIPHYLKWILKSDPDFWGTYPRNHGLVPEFWVTYPRSQGHSLPTRVTWSQLKTKKAHKLSDSIDNNISAARKHEKTMFWINCKLKIIFIMIMQTESLSIL